MTTTASPCKYLSLSLSVSSLLLSFFCDILSMLYLSLSVICPSLSIFFYASLMHKYCLSLEAISLSPYLPVSTQILRKYLSFLLFSLFSISSLSSCPVRQSPLFNYLSLSLYPFIIFLFFYSSLSSARVVTHQLSINLNLYFSIDSLRPFR